MNPSYIIYGDYNRNNGSMLLRKIRSYARFETDPYYLAKVKQAVAERVYLDDDSTFDAIIKYQNGDISQLDPLFKAYHLLILKLSAGALRIYKKRGQIDEILSLSYSTFLTCLKKYTVSEKLSRFSTYLSTAILHNIIHYIPFEHTRIRYRIQHISALDNIILNDLSINPNQSIHDILPDDTIKKYWKHINYLTIVNVYKQNHIPIKVSDQPLMHIDIDECFKNLNDRQKRILTRRLNGDILHDIGIDENITRERVRQIEAQALSKIKKIIESQNRLPIKPIKLPEKQQVILLTYDEAKKFIKLHYIKSRAAYIRFARICVQLPLNPRSTYKHSWKGWKSFLSRR